MTLPSTDDEGAWSNDHFYRWIGQKYDDGLINLFLVVYDKTPDYDKPMWAKGLYWFLKNRNTTEFDDCPWDFGLTADAYLYKHKVTMMDDLLPRLHKRREELKILYDDY